MDDTLFVELILAGILPSLMVALMHYWSPARLSRTTRYVMGTLAINLPVSAFLVSWRIWPALGLLWIATLAAGSTTLVCYLIDHWRQVHLALKISEQEGADLREVIDAQDARQL